MPTVRTLMLNGKTDHMPGGLLTRFPLCFNKVMSFNLFFPKQETENYKNLQVEEQII